MKFWRVSNILILSSCLYLFLVSWTGCAVQINSTPLWAPAMPDSIVAQSPNIAPDELALSIHNNTNLIRKQEGLSELKWNEAISSIAQSHSEDMAQNGYFSHTNPQGEGASERATRFGFSGIHTNKKYVVVGIGENLFATHRYEEYLIAHDSLNGSPQYFVKWKSLESISNEAVKAWLQSPPHRKNLLSTAYTIQGIGVSIGSNGTIFVTQNLN